MKFLNLWDMILNRKEIDGEDMILTLIMRLFKSSNNTTKREKTKRKLVPKTQIKSKMIMIKFQTMTQKLKLALEILE
jgi:hypothetical protein